MGLNVQKEIAKTLEAGWELVDAKLKNQPQAQTVKAFKKTVILSLEETMRINKRPEYVEVEAQDENQDTLKFPDRN